jgi:hypothetical protein
MPRRRAQPVVTINPLFKLLIVINLSLCVVSLVVMVVVGLTAVQPITELQRQLYSACETVFKMTTGAFIGLLGGKAASPDAVREPETDEGADKPKKAEASPAS